MWFKKEKKKRNIAIGKGTIKVTDLSGKTYSTEIIGEHIPGDWGFTVTARDIFNEYVNPKKSLFRINRDLSLPASQIKYIEFIADDYHTIEVEE